MATNFFDTITHKQVGALTESRWYFADDVDAEIARLQQQVTDLQRQLADLKSWLQGNKGVIFIESKDKNKHEPIYAGLDTDAVAKLFHFKGNRFVKIEHAEWATILDDYGAQAGETLIVSLSKQAEE